MDMSNTLSMSGMTAVAQNIQEVLLELEDMEDALMNDFIHPDTILSGARKRYEAIGIPLPDDFDCHFAPALSLNSDLTQQKTSH